MQYDFSRTASVIIGTFSLWLVEDCVISLNHLSRGDYSEALIVKIAAFYFCQCYAGIDKRNERKYNFKERKICY